MATTAFVYGGFLQSLANKEIDMDTDTIKVMLCTSSYTPNQDTHRYKSSVTNEATGTGYTAGGVALTSLALTYTAGTNTLMFDAADVSFGSSTSITARYAVIYDATPATDATRPLIAYIDFGQDMASVNGPFGLTFNAAGIVTLTT